jgi:hypothetical protein
VNLADGQRVKESKFQRYEKGKDVQQLVMKFIPISGDQHLLNQSTTNATMSVLRTTIAGTQTFIFSIPRTKPVMPTKPTKSGCQTNTKLGLNPFIQIEGENT